jgi:hypothetical protein
MRQTFIVLGILFFCSNAFAEEPAKKDSYEQAFRDGCVYALVVQYELDIDTDYEMLKKLEKQEDEGLKQVREHFVRGLNAKLNTLGHIIEDMDNKKILSPRFFKFVKEQDEITTRNLEKKIGKEKYAKLKDSIEGAEVFWKRLKKEREQNNWKMEIENEKLRALFEKYVDLALDVYCQYGNAFKIEESSQ